MNDWFNSGGLKGSGSRWNRGQAPGVQLTPAQAALTTSRDFDRDPSETATAGIIASGIARGRSESSIGRSLEKSQRLFSGGWQSGAKLAANSFSNQPGVTGGLKANWGKQTRFSLGPGVDPLAAVKGGTSLGAVVPAGKIAVTDPMKPPAAGGIGGPAKPSGVSWDPSGQEDYGKVASEYSSVGAGNTDSMSAGASAHAALLRTGQPVVVTPGSGAFSNGAIANGAGVGALFGQKSVGAGRYYVPGTDGVIRRGVSFGMDAPAVTYPVSETPHQELRDYASKTAGFTGPATPTASLGDGVPAPVDSRVPTAFQWAEKGQYPGSLLRLR